MSTRPESLRIGLPLALLCLGLIVAGCGGSASSSSSSEAGSGAEPSAQFSKPKGNGKKDVAEKIVKAGSEASAQERGAANAVVVENLQARAAADFTTQCESLSLKTITTAIADAKDRQGCPAALKKVAEPLSKTKEAREDTLDGSIAAMRVGGDKGYALYHGSDGKDWAVPLEKEDGNWKVAALVMIEL